MKSIILILSVCVAVYAVEYYDLPEDDYTPKGLNGNLKEVEKRLDCYIDQGPCAEMATAYKNVAADMVKTKCARCSPTVKKLSCAFLKTTKDNFPEKYLVLRYKYDVSGLNFEQFEKSLECTATNS